MVDLAVDRLNAALHTGTTSSVRARSNEIYGSERCTPTPDRPARYDRDPSFRSIIDVVPFGLPSRAAAGDATARDAQMHPRLGDRTTRSCSGTAASGTGSMPRRAVRALRAAVGAAPAGEARLHGRIEQPRGACARPQKRGESPTTSGCSDRSSTSTTNWVPYGERAALAARGRLRHLDPRRASRDALRVPHAPARLLLGEAAGGVQRRR